MKTRPICPNQQCITGVWTRGSSGQESRHEMPIALWNHCMPDLLRTKTKLLITKNENMLMAYRSLLILDSTSHHKCLKILHWPWFYCPNFPLLWQVQTTSPPWEREESSIFKYVISHKILLHGWFREHGARWREPSVLIGDPTKISLCWLLEIVRVVPATKLIVFIQACSGKMAR